MQNANIVASPAQPASRALHVGLWVAQIVLALMFGMAGVMKSTQPIDGHREVLAALDWRPEPVERLELAASARAAHAEFREITAPPWSETVATAKAIRQQRRSS